MDHKEGWVLKNWCFWTMVLKILENPLDCKRIKQVSPKGNQSWIFTGRTNAEAEAPVLWPPDAKGQIIGKDPDAGKDWRQEEKGMTEDEMVGWHHWLDGRDWASSERCEGQRSPACCSPWGRKEWDVTERLNWTELLNSTVKDTPGVFCLHRNGIDLSYPCLDLPSYRMNFILLSYLYVCYLPLHFFTFISLDMFVNSGTVKEDKIMR